MPPDRHPALRRYHVEAAAGRAHDLAAGLQAAVSASDGATVHPIGPGRWRLLAPAEADLGSRLQNRNDVKLFLDVGDGYRVLVLDGANAATVLPQIARIEFDALGPDAFVSTDVHGMTVEIHRRGETVELAVSRSFGDCLAEILADLR